MKKHLTAEEIERYIDSEYVQNGIEFEQISSEAILKIEEHIVDCDECLQKMQKAIDFSLDYETWMALKPTEEQRAVIAMLMQVGNSQTEEVKGRLRKWMNNWRKISEYTLDILFNTTYKGAANITRIVKDTAKNAQEVISFEHPVQCYAMRGTTTEFKKELKNQIIGIVDDASVVNINAERETNSIRISFPVGKEKGRVPLILLIPVEQGEQSKMLKPELNSVTNQLEAVIDNVNSGKYILAIEPLDLF